MNKRVHSNIILTQRHPCKNTGVYLYIHACSRKTDVHSETQLQSGKYDRYIIARGTGKLGHASFCQVHMVFRGDCNLTQRKCRTGCDFDIRGNETFLDAAMNLTFSSCLKDNAVFLFRLKFFLLEKHGIDVQGTAQFMTVQLKQRTGSIPADVHGCKAHGHGSRFSVLLQCRAAAYARPDFQFYRHIPGQCAE